MTPARKAEIRTMLNAATPGPWQWFGNTNVKSLYLATVHHGRRFVMQFVRWGMQDGQPRFQVNNLMVDGSTLVRYERPYRKDVDGIDHPDARLIEQAPALIGELLAATDDDAAELARLREQVRVLREALAPFAAFADTFTAMAPDEQQVAEWGTPKTPILITVGNLRTARAALAATTPTDPPAAWHGSTPHDTNGDVK